MINSKGQTNSTKLSEHTTNIRLISDALELIALSENVIQRAEN